MPSTVTDTVAKTAEPVVFTRAAPVTVSVVA
jgi:hypothetical protein